MVVTAPVQTNQFADDTALQSSALIHTQAAAQLQESVNSTGVWLRAWHLRANLAKTKTMEIHRRKIPFSTNISLYGEKLATTDNHKHLGIIFSADLRWTKHVDAIIMKTSRLLGVLRRIHRSLTRHALSTFYLIYIRPILEYADIAWSNLPTTQSDRLERTQRKAARIILGLSLYEPTSHSRLLSSLNWPTLSSRRKLHLAQLGYALHTRTAPAHLLEAAFPPRSTPYALRHSTTFDTPIAHTNTYRDSPIFLSSTIYNTLPQSIRDAKSTAQFKALASDFLLEYTCSCSTFPYPH